MPQLDDAGSATPDAGLGTVNWAAKATTEQVFSNAELISRNTIAASLLASTALASADVKKIGVAPASGVTGSWPQANQPAAYADRPKPPELGGGSARPRGAYYWGL